MQDFLLALKASLIESLPPDQQTPELWEMRLYDLRQLVLRKSRRK